ncbi:major capsid protein [Anaerophaga thermohalophila]|jgi:hypothetical protein|uniref:major capsid protein n=1 Tax=Anaerophaga thermohalophila TaxID=177400 RepID=UPI000237C811|nr:major capsid protein [Anaerophaga thermohalophila]
MQLQSLFPEYVKKYFSAIVTKVIETVNGAKNAPVYLFKTMLSEEYSTDLKWSSLSLNGSIVAADVVAMDSPLPLKKRDSIKKAEGDIPKLGLKLYLSEKQLSDLDILVARGGREADVVAKLFGDAKKAITGIEERLEFMFLQALSSGVTSITSENNAGIGVRIDYGIPDENKVKVATVWSDAINATPLDDIEKIVEAGSPKGHVFTKILMDRATFNNFKKTAQVKERNATALGLAVTSATKPPVPTLTQVNEFLLEDYNLIIQVVDRAVQIEKNGKRTAVKPWTEGAVTFITTEQIGSLFYGSLAEENHPVENVAYEKATNYTLVSKYHKNDPLREYTSAQANVLPVLNGVDAIYILDTKNAAA